MKNVKMLILSVAVMVSAVVGISASEEKKAFTKVFSIYKECDCFSNEEGRVLVEKYCDELGAIFELQNKTQDERRRLVIEFLRTEDSHGITPMMYVIRNYAKNPKQDNVCSDLLSSSLRQVDFYSDLLKSDDQTEDSNK